ncbi:hypothetical protein C8J56DRAFT_881969 [Mycena floridula]|nr:hypothetical protein C8J56DRAFT_881969 [Mycena floridula]
MGCRKKNLTEEEMEQRLQVRHNRAHVYQILNAHEYKAKARERIAKIAQQLLSIHGRQPMHATTKGDAIGTAIVPGIEQLHRNCEDIQYRAREAYKRAPGMPIVFYVLWEGPDEGIYMDWATMKRYKGDRGATKRTSSYDALSCWRWNCLQHHRHHDPAKYNSFQDPFVTYPELRGPPQSDESAQPPASSPQVGKVKGKGRAPAEDPVFYVIRGARAIMRYSDRQEADRVFASATAAGTVGDRQSDLGEEIRDPEEKDQELEAYFLFVFKYFAHEMFRVYSGVTGGGENSTWVR